LLVEEHRVARMLAESGERFDVEPHLLSNARSLRELKGEDWWSREHRLGSLLESVQA
jgi:hypothetical protein